MCWKRRRGVGAPGRPPVQGGTVSAGICWDCGERETWPVDGTTESGHVVRLLVPLSPCSVVRVGSSASSVVRLGSGVRADEGMN